ncbi:hypothetical protein [Paenibacillus agilis]|uniref:hypothetical protein n=1 Tax=Paenibacillus agilis TaxID=3020863 RepID=UPI001649C785|nr:hypothetical protein [Paenibacillus agilis]
MGYIDFVALTKKATMKPDGDVEIVLNVEGAELRGQFERLNEMLGIEVRVSVDPTIVRYSVPVNAQTNKPIKTYTVDNTGVVSEVKPDGEQLELELEGAPKGKTKIKQEQHEIDKEIVDDFIAEGMATTYEDMPYYFPSLVQRLRRGETYMSFAEEIGVDASKVADIFDEYRKRVAPLAVPWDEWRQGQGQAVAKTEATESPDENQNEQEDEQQAETSEETDSQQQATPEAETEHAADKIEVPDEEIEAYILEHKPVIEGTDVDGKTIDWAECFTKRKNKVTWMEIGKGLGLSSSKLSKGWNKYKEEVAKLIINKSE